jgi:Domain of Unknown Function (DUF1259)
MLKAVVASLAIIVSLATPSGVRARSSWNSVAAALGKPGSELPGGVYRVGLPRTDLHVVVDGVAIRPTLALASWLAFRPTGDTAMVMGDLVLTETEISPVMQELIAGGIEITALHNHLLRAQPATFYMHVRGQGDAVKLATALHDGIALSRTPLGTPAAAPALAIDLDTAMIDRVLGARGQVAGGVYQVSVRRAETIRDAGMDIPPAMGSAEAMNFQPTGGGKVAIAGDFVLTAPEVNPVLRALRDSGIEVTALHNHMLDDQPRLFFMHFWANDDAAKLATGLRSALDRINVARS